MSTVVDNDKYIINGSTLSEIGDAIKGQMLNQYEKVTGDVVYYEYKTLAKGDDVELLNLTEEKIQEWYHNTLPSPITKVKILCFNNSGGSGRPYAEVNGNKKYIASFKFYTYSLPVTFISSGNGDLYIFDIYPLNGDNFLSWDSNYYYPSSSSDYNEHEYKKEGFSYYRSLPKSNFLVSDIAQKIASLPSLPGAQIDFIKMHASSSDGTNLLTTMGIKDISDIYYIIGYNDYYDRYDYKYPKGLVYLDMVNNPPVSTSTYENQTINHYQFYYIPQTSSSSDQYHEDKPYVRWAYWKSHNCFLDSSNPYSERDLVKDSDADPAFVMVIHKPTSSS